MAQRIRIGLKLKENSFPAQTVLAALQDLHGMNSL